MLEAETTGASLFELAHREHLDPAVAYRLVRRVTGLRWSEARRGGVTLALARLHAARREAPLGDARVRDCCAPQPLGEAGPAPTRPSSPGAPPRPTRATHPDGAP